MPVYLSRSSRFRSHQRFNLGLLQAALGERVQVHYPRHSLAKGLKPNDLAQQPAVFLLAEPNAERVSPVRLGQIAGVQDEDERLELSILLGGFPAESLDRSAFTSWFNQHTESGVQVFNDPAGFSVPAEWDPTRRVDAFRAVVRDLQASDGGAHFEQTTFLLPQELIDAEDDRQADPLQLTTGRTYRQRMHCLSTGADTSDQNPRLGLGYDRTEFDLLQYPETLPDDGPVEATFRLMVPGSARLNCFVRPHGERSSQLRFDYHVNGQVLPRLLACEEAGESLREGLRGLLALLKRHQALENPELSRAVLDSMLAMLPDDDELLRALAHHFHGLAQHTRAVGVFDRLGAERLAPDDWLPHFLSACQTDPQRPTGELVAMLDRLPWERVDTQAARAIGRSVAGLPEKAILELLEPLAYLGSDRFLTDIWSALRPAILSADGILAAARMLDETHLDSPANLYGFVSTRARQDDFQQPDFHEWLVQTGLRIDPVPAGWADSLQRHLGALVADDQAERAIGMLQTARPHLSAGAFEGVRLGLADALLQSGSQRDAQQASGLLSEAANASRVRGDLDESVVLLERAALADPDNDSLPTLQAKLEQSIEASDHVQLLAETLFSQRVKQLRDKLSKTRLLVVGGRQQKPWADQIRRELALSELSWITSELGHPPRAEKLSGALNQSLGAVAVLTFYLGHGPAETVREEARRLDIPCAYVVNGTSKNALLRALIKAVLE